MNATHDSGIYRIVCTITNECYVGRSATLRNRFATHLRDLRAGTHESPALQSLYDLHGEQRIRFEVVEPVEHPDEEKDMDRRRLSRLSSLLGEREKEWMAMIRPTLNNARWTSEDKWEYRQIDGSYKARKGSPASDMTDGHVLAIRELYANCGWSISKIAQTYGMNYGRAKNIATGRTRLNASTIDNATMMESFLYATSI